MSKLTQWGILWITALFVLIGAGTAYGRHERDRDRDSDDECLELGWKNQNDRWTFYRAHVLEYQENGRVHMSYEFNGGELELRFKEHERSDGDNVIVAKGKWFEGAENVGQDEGHWGRVFLKFENGHHWAKGWFSYGEQPTHYDMALRACRR